VPPWAAQELRHYLHHVMAACSTTGTEVVLVVDRSGSQRAHQLDATLEHDKGKVPRQMFPAHCGHHLTPSAGFWRARKEASGAGRGFRALPLLSQRTRQGLMTHQERPMYAFHW
jgi:hypothetical protein